MKKLYFALLAAIFAIVANAEVVKFTNPDGWAQVSAYVYGGAGELLGKWPGTAMTQEGDLWTVDVPGTPEKIIFNNNNKGSQTGNLDFVAGATYDKNGAIGAELNDYKVYFDNKAGWNKVYIYTWGPAMAGGWPGTELQKNSDGLYEWVYQATSTPSFDGIKFSDGNGQETDDLTYEVGKTYTNGNGDDPEPPTPGTQDVYLVGSFNNWNPIDDDYKMEQNGNVYTYTFTKELEAGTKIKIANTWDWSFGCGVIGEIANDTDMDAWWNGSDFTFDTLEEGQTVSDLKVTFTLVEGSAVKGSSIPSVIRFNYTIKGGDDPEPPTPVTQDVYLVGTFNNWTPADEAYKMTQDGNVYTYVFTDETFTNDDELKLVGDKTWAWNFAAGDTLMALDTDIDAWFDSQTNFSFAGIDLTENEVISDLKVTFTLVEGSAVKNSSTPSTIRFSYEIRTGVESVIADNDNANVEYYNLQGVRVDNPTNGLYIRVAGNKATKVRL